MNRLDAAIETLWVSEHEADAAGVTEQERSILNEASVMSYLLEHALTVGLLSVN